VWWSAAGMVIGKGEEAFGTINLLAPELFIFILAHTVYKM